MANLLLVGWTNRQLKLAGLEETFFNYKSHLLRVSRALEVVKIDILKKLH
jgi:hypothetical protein